jgi:hypothetical protein
MAVANTNIVPRHIFKQAMEEVTDEASSTDAIELRPTCEGLLVLVNDVVL